MKKHLTNSIVLFVSLVLTSLTTFAGSRDLQSAKVSVYPHIQDGKPAYTYMVENTSGESITKVLIGYEHYTGSTELSGNLPLEVISPAGWNHRIVYLEESNDYEVWWLPSSPINQIAPNQSKTGFTIIMDSETPELINASWTVLLSGSPVRVSDKLAILDNAPDDLIPPQLTISLLPEKIWPPNNKFVSVSAFITATDNADPAPIISLVSVICNECDPSVEVQGAEVGSSDFNFEVKASRTGQAKSGRVYTVTYSATDASGNVTYKSANITIPHDQRK